MLFRFLLGMLLLMAAGYALYLGLLFTQQRSMMFPGTQLVAQANPLPPWAEPVDLDTSFGTAKAVLLTPTPDTEAMPAAVYFHGNYELVEHNLDLLAPLTDSGLAILLVEYPGYAGSDGEPSLASLRETAERAYDWLAAQPRFDPARIIAIGRSIGSGPACELSRSRDLRALILLAPFTAISDFARRFAAPALLIRDRFDNRDALQGFRRPVLILHGRSDAVIPYRHGQALAETAEQARLITLDCGHNDCAFFGPTMIEEMRAFLTDADVLPQVSSALESAP